ncbi:MAG: helix-turn-helix domain-containing protein [Rhodobacteraceae bacterium]|nr:helix-turn-helix domain-containing protein [Paracoccaceae bacterium]
MNWVSTSPLNTLEPDALARLANVQASAVPKGTPLFHAGDEVQGFAVVLSGKVGVYLTGAGGREILLYDITPGKTCVQSTIGLMSQELYSAEAVCEVDTRLALLPRPLFSSLLSTSPAFRDYVFSAFAERMQSMMHLLEQVAFVRIESRLATALLDLAEPTAHITHAELATRIGTAREVVSRRLDNWSKRGFVNLERGSITVLQPTELQNLLET